VHLTISKCNGKGRKIGIDQMNNGCSQQGTTETKEGSVCAHLHFNISHNGVFR